MVAGWTWNEPPINHTGKTPTKTESNSYNRHGNQALHSHRQATSYTQANMGDPVINRQNMVKEKVYNLQFYNEK